MQGLAPLVSYLGTITTSSGTEYLLTKRLNGRDDPLAFKAATRSPDSVCVLKFCYIEAPATISPPMLESGKIDIENELRAMKQLGLPRPRLYGEFTGVLKLADADAACFGAEELRTRLNSSVGFKVWGFILEYFAASDMLTLMECATVRRNPLSDKRISPFGTRITKYIALRILDELAVLHAKGFAHCDLKPENILLLEPLGEPVLLDYSSLQEVATPSRLLAITLDYGAPEVDVFKIFQDILGPGVRLPETNYAVRRPRDYRHSDRFTLGVIIFFTLSYGCFPFNVPDIDKLLEAIKTSWKISDVAKLSSEEIYEKLASLWLGLNVGYRDLAKGDSTKLWGNLVHTVFSRGNDITFLKTEPQLKDLLTALWQPDPELRPSLDEIRGHPWFAQDVADQSEVMKTMQRLYADYRACNPAP